MPHWDKPITEMKVGDIVEATYYSWNPIARWMLGAWEETGKRKYRVIAEFDVFDRDYPIRLDEIRHKHKDAEVIGYERKILVLVPEGPFIPKY
jgi:hypothetical protein